MSIINFEMESTENVVSSFQNEKKTMIAYYYRQDLCLYGRYNLLNHSIMFFVSISDFNRCNIIISVNILQDI